jgi:hypothetical protein
MLSQQIRSSASLLDSIDAIRNWRALLVLLASLVAAAVLFSLGGVLARFGWALFLLFALAAYAVVFYGANAAGMMLMDEARGQLSRAPAAAVRDSLAVSHRLILVFLLLFALYLGAFLALALVLFLCKIPVIGPVLYAVVFPASVVVFGIAMFALPTVVFPLSAPSIWNGATTLQCVSQLLAIARKRLILVLLLMVAVAFIAGLVGFLVGAILFTGAAVTALASAPILGGGLGGIMGGVMGGGMDMDMGMAMGGLGGHAIGAAVGGGVLFAVAFTLPGMVYLRGACSVYLRAIEGLDLAAEQAEIDAKLEAARARAREMQPVMAPAAPPAAAAVAAPVAVPVVAAPVTPAVAAPAVVAPAPPMPAAATAPAKCPHCGAAITPGDAFCGECGERL